MNKIVEAIRVKADELIRQADRVITDIVKNENEVLLTYNQWYSASLALVQANLPTREAELVALHGGSKNTRGIPDFLAEPGKHTQALAVPKVRQIRGIVASVPQYVEASLHNVELAVADRIVSDLLTEAKSLIKAGYVRAAGAVAGVMLERHLKLLCDRHRPRIKYPAKATISRLNDLLKNEDVYDQAQWRKVQWMGDIRNLCDHARRTEPRTKDVRDLISEIRNFIALLVK
jgi:hypothetical protein